MKKTRTRVGSILLTLALVLTLLPVSALAADPVAGVGDTTYTSLQEAFNNADGKTVKLLEDVYLTETVSVSAGKTVILDLNGKEITVYKNEETGRSLYAINNYGDFTLLDSAENGTITARGIQNLENGVMTIESGKIVSCDSNGGAAVWNEANVTINGGTFETIHVGSASDSVGVGCLNNSGTALVTGGTFKDINKRTYAVISTGEIEITPSNGKEVIVEGAHGGLGIDSGTATVNGGTYSSTDYYGLYVSNDGMGEDPMTAAVTVNGGTFDGKSYSVWIGSDYNDPVNSSIAIYGGTFNDPLNAQENTRENAIIVYGGTFSDDSVKEYMAANYECVGPVNGKYTVQKLEDKLVVSGSVGQDGTVSGSLEGSFGGIGTAVDDNTSGTIAGEGDTTTTTNDVSISLTTKAGNATTTTLRVTKDTAQSLNNAEKLTVKTDAAEVSFDSAALSKIASGAGNATGDVTISVTDTTNSPSSSGSNVKASYEVSVTAGSTNLLPNSSTDNGEVKITVLVPTGAENSTLYAWYVQGDVYVEPLQMDKVGGKLVITINHLSEIHITDQDFKSNVVASYTDSDNKIHYYDNLAEAIEEAPAGGTVKLEKPTEISNYISVNKNLVIDFGGNTLSSTGAGFDLAYTNSGTTLELKNGTLNVASWGVWVQNGGKLTIAGDMTVTSTSQENNKATVVVEGIGSTATVYGKVCSDKSAAISGIGNPEDGGAIVDIKAGAHVESTNSLGVYFPTINGKLTVSGTVIGGDTGIEIRAGELTVNEGAEIKGGNGKPDADPNGNGSTTTNTGIAIAQHTTKQPITVNINGGTISGGAAIYESNPQENASTGNPVTVNVKNAELNGNVNATGFGNIAMTNVEITGNVNNQVDGVTSSGKMSIVGSKITGRVPNTGVTIVNSTVNGSPTNKVPDEAKALVGATTYNSLSEAVSAAKPGDTVVLLDDVTLDGQNVGNNSGILTITNNITLDGNGKTITAENVSANAATAAGPSMINIQGGAKVTVKNLTIDGAGTDNSVTTDNTKHGLNVYGAGTEITVENVTIKNGNGYGIVVNGAKATINGLTTENNGWGGVNVDSKSGEASLTINNANVSEANSVKIENSADDHNDPAVDINGGTFQYITVGESITNKDDLELTISGGKFATGSFEGAINVNEYLESGLVLDSNGNVVKDTSSTTPDTPSTPSTSDKDDDDDDGYSITIPASSSVRGGSISVNPRRADKGDTVTITVTPDDGYVLKDLTVTARSGGEVDLTKKNSTQYTFKMPAGAVVIEVSFAESDSAAEVEMSFTDVPSDYWAVSEISWAFENGYMNGTSATTFNPGGTVSRQQVWMILARMAGADPADMAAAKAWAVANGISDGTNPGGAVSRQQLVALLYRFAAQNGYDTSARADLSGYPDVASLASYAAEPMAWSVAGGIIGGTTQGTLNPAGTATRAQFAAILWRFYQTTAV